MPSFDVVCEANMVELKNAVEQANKEISTRFDFKGSDARVEHKDQELTLFGDDDFKLGQVKDVLLTSSPSVVSTCASWIIRTSRRSAATR